jgi:hypothetical protein
MKKLLLFVATATMLFACGRDYKSVRLPNGAIIKALNTSDIDYGVGSRVCVYKTTRSDWNICQDGEMRDTIYMIPRKTEQGMTSFHVQHKVGLVSSHL